MARSETKFQEASASVNQLENRKLIVQPSSSAVAAAKGRVMAVVVPMTLGPSPEDDHAD